MAKNEEINPLDAILNQYEENTKSSGSSKPKISNDERLKKYFTEKLKKGEKSAEKVFRILPSKDPKKSPFVEVYIHEMTVNGKFEKVLCPKLNNGEECEICNAKDALEETGGKKQKAMASSMTARKFYVVKGIDRNNEDHGVKFWRFKHKFDGSGVMDKLVPVLRKRGNIMDPRNGRDIEITTERNSKGHSVVTSIMVSDEKVLTDPKSPEAKEWMGNDETWKDVYSIKSPEWISIVAKQKTPVWDSELKKYVAEEDKEEKETASLEEEINMMDALEDEDVETVEEMAVESTSLDDEDDELPF
jgi:hypothetical protein